MEFSVNSPVLFVLAGIVILAVLAQSAYFLAKAWRRAKAIGMDMDKLRRIARTAAIFTIAPAVAIVISVITLAKDLGVPLPWLRLSVVGSMSYETIAATNAESAMGLTFGQVSALTARMTIPARTNSTGLLTLNCIFRPPSFVCIQYTPTAARAQERPRGRLPSFEPSRGGAMKVFSQEAGKSCCVFGRLLL